MPWQNDEIAGPMGYTYCVLFDCARDALKAWPFEISLPGNICPDVYAARPNAMLEEVNQKTGLATFSPTHLYGYQSLAWEGFELSLDPLMTGWVRHLKTPSAIISFGRKKMLSIGYGGAFLTNDQASAEHMEEKSRWNNRYNPDLLLALDNLGSDIRKRFDIIALWDRYLGDSLLRVPAEQLIPWRVMRRAKNLFERNRIVQALRNAGYDVGTNYGPVGGTNIWGDTVLNFFCSPDLEKTEIDTMCDIIKREVDDG